LDSGALRFFLKFLFFFKYFFFFRRFTKRIFIPLPDKLSRKMLISNLISKNKNSFNINEEQLDKISDLTENYSASDLTNLTKECSLIPVRLNLLKKFKKKLNFKKF
jgi:SpoVK/Ycf46/Vps4 family AAA+-type ATPase